jgi:hypothetical protein
MSWASGPGEISYRSKQLVLEEWRELFESSRTIPSPNSIRIGE